MKTIKKIMIVVAIVFATSIIAQTPPPNDGIDPTANGSGNTPVGGGAPIGGGIMILASMGLAYGYAKFILNRDIGFSSEET